jgi:hypothetical protein
MFENRVLRRIFGPKMGEMVGGRRELHTGELHKLSKLNIFMEDIKNIEAGETCSTHVFEEECIQKLAGKPRRK